MGAVHPWAAPSGPQLHHARAVRDGDTVTGSMLCTMRWGPQAGVSALQPEAVLCHQQRVYVHCIGSTFSRMLSCQCPCVL